MSTGDEKQTVPVSPGGSWRWPIDVTRYDRSPELNSVEQEAVQLFVKPPRDRAVVLAKAEQQGTLARLIQPLRDALDALEGEKRLKVNTLYLYLRMCARDGRSFWAWEYETWLNVLSTSLAGFSLCTSLGTRPTCGSTSLAWPICSTVSATFQHWEESRL